MSSRREIILRIATPLTPLYGKREARQIALVVASELSGVAPSALLANPGAPLRIEDLDQTIAQLTAGRPLQYVLGTTEFCGLRIGVREGVLIPRPETEELVRWIADQHPRAQHLLDVGTGSGCIALALKHLLPQAVVTGIDNSPEALSIARTNATALGLHVEFREADALTELPSQLPGPFDVIVSNPPYIPTAEQAAMHRNVIDFEPADALFVPDDDPLRFYRAIAHAARTMLTHGGYLYFEIHERFGDDICRMLRDAAFDSVLLRYDFHDKPRMVCCRKNA